MTILDVLRYWFGKLAKDQQDRVFMFIGKNLDGQDWRTWEGIQRLLIVLEKGRTST